MNNLTRRFDFGVSNQDAGVVIARITVLLNKSGPLGTMPPAKLDEFLA